MNRLILVFGTLTAISAFAAGVPNELSGYWEIHRTYDDAHNESSLQNCGLCEEGQYLSFSGQEAWLLKGRCEKPTYELHAVRYSKLMLDLFSGKDLKEQAEIQKDGDYSHPIRPEEIVRAIHIRCAGKSAEFLPNASDMDVGGNEVWAVLRSNGELLVQLGITGMYSAKRVDSHRKASPSFDCAKAVSAQEKLICSEPVLASRDRVLSKAYSSALKDANAKCKKVIRKTQKKWISTLRPQAGTDKGSLASTMYTQADILLDLPEGRDSPCGP